MPEFLGRLRTPRISAAPASPVVGEMYCNTTTNRLYWWNGSVWVAEGIGRALPLLSLGAKLVWLLNEPAGITAAVDLSGNGNNGVIGAGVTLGNAGHAVPSSALFNATSTGVITSSYAPFVVNSLRTYVGWANRNVATGANVLFGSSVNYPAAPFVQLSTATSVDFYAGTTSAVSWTVWPGTNQWVNWALTYNDSTRVAEFFLNGASQGTRTHTAGNGYPVTGGTFQAGMFFTNGNPWGGNMQEIAIFERILTAAEIAAIYRGPV